jgi:hypothetical protein
MRRPAILAAQSVLAILELDAMKTLLRAALAAAFLATVAGSAHAGDLTLTIGNGRVTLVAKDVTVREILAEWSRVGQTRIINAEKVTGAPVTLELDNVPEAQALDTVLRSAAGYVMAPRAAGSAGPSVYDRIMILASSRPPATSPSTPSSFTARPMPQVNPNPAPDDDQEFEPAQVGPAVINPPGVNAAPGANPAGAANPGFGAQPGQPGQPAQQVPMTAPRPGMLPAPAPAQNGAPNPYLGTPPGPAAPGFNPNPPPPPPRGPGGGI